MRDALRTIVDRMLALLPVHPEMLIWQPDRAIPRYFPRVGLKALPATSPFVADKCMCDGFYERELTPGRPWILYRADVPEERIRFTLLHELGHHLVWDVDPNLLDLIDQAAGRDGDLKEVEEWACHRFAAALLLSDRMVDYVLGSAKQPGVAHVLALRRASPASWEAVAVRVAQRMRTPGAVALLRTRGRVAFVATSPGLPGSWSRNSLVEPNGVLARALDYSAAKGRDRFAWNLWNERPLWCSTQRVSATLAIAVMHTAPDRDYHGPDEGAASGSHNATNGNQATGTRLEEPLRLQAILDEALASRPDSMVSQVDAVERVEAAGADTQRPLRQGLEAVRSWLRPGSVCVVASRPGVGRTALSLWLSLDIVRTSDIPVGIASLELSEKEIGRRLLAAEAGIDLMRLRTGRLDDTDWRRLLLALPHLAQAPITILPTRHGLSLTELTRRCLTLKQRDLLGLLVVDCIQLLTNEPDSPSVYCDPHLTIGRLKHLAIELNMAVIAVSQVGRRVEEHVDRRPELSDLPEHRALVQATDTVLALHSPIDSLHTCAQIRPVELIITLNRIGPTGTLDLSFDARTQRFQDQHLSRHASTPLTHSARV